MSSVDPEIRRVSFTDLDWLTIDRSTSEYLERDRLFRLKIATSVAYKLWTGRRQTFMSQFMESLRDHNQYRFERGCLIVEPVMIAGEFHLDMSESHQGTGLKTSSEVLRDRCLDMG